MTSGYIRRKSLGGGKLQTCKLSTLAPCLCSNRYVCAGISAFSSVLSLEGQSASFISPCGCGGIAHQLPTNAVLGGVGLRLLFLITSRTLAQEKSCMISAELSGRHG